MNYLEKHFLNRANLKMIIIVFILFFVGVSIYVFASTMSISERTKNAIVPGILIKGIGSEKLIEIDGSPVLILNKNNNEFIVWDLIPKFSNKRKAGCSIVKVPSDNDYNFSFAEPCNGIRYSETGEVIQPTFPLALPMEKINWSIDGDYLVISKNT